MEVRSGRTRHAEERRDNRLAPDNRAENIFVIHRSPPQSHRAAVKAGSLALPRMIKLADPGAYAKGLYRGVSRLGMMLELLMVQRG